MFFAFSLFLNAKERLAAHAPSIDLHYQHDCIHTQQSCWLVPCWYNCAKKHGLGVTVELVIIGTQLQHLQMVGSTGIVQSALLELGSILVQLWPLEEASNMCTTTREVGMQAENIRVIKGLLQGSQAEQSKAASLVQGLGQEPFKFRLGNPIKGVLLAEQEARWQEMQGHIQAFVCNFVEPFLRANPGIWLRCNNKGFPTLVFPADVSTYDVCLFLLARAKRTLNSCNARNRSQQGLQEENLDKDGISEEFKDAAEASEHGMRHQYMGPLAAAGFLLMTASTTLVPESAAVDPFDGSSLSDPWSAFPLFSGPTTLIAHIDHGQFLHLGFKTNTPHFGD